jgi:hypothetical protein
MRVTGHGDNSEILQSYMLKVQPSFIRAQCLRVRMGYRIGEAQRATARAAMSCAARHVVSCATALWCASLSLQIPGV